MDDDRQEFDAGSSKPDLRLVSSREGDLLAQKQQTDVMKQRAWDMYTVGASGTTVAQTLGVPVTRVMRWLRDEAEARAKERSHTLARERGIATAERMVTSLAPDAMAGKAGMGKNEAANALLRWEERLAKLQGTDAPTKIAATTPDGGSWAPLELKLTALTDAQLVALREANSLLLGVGKDEEPVEGEVIEPAKAEGE